MYLLTNFLEAVHALRTSFAQKEDLLWLLYRSTIPSIVSFFPWVILLFVKTETEVPLVRLHRTKNPEEGPYFGLSTSRNHFEFVLVLGDGDVWNAFFVRLDRDVLRKPLGVVGPWREVSRNSHFLYQIL